MLHVRPSILHLKNLKRFAVLSHLSHIDNYNFINAGFSFLLCCVIPLLFNDWLWISYYYNLEHKISGKFLPINYAFLIIFNNLIILYKVYSSHCIIIRKTRAPQDFCSMSKRRLSSRKKVWIKVSQIVYSTIFIVDVNLSYGDLGNCKKAIVVGMKI